jgi:DNA-directed RNA polymerase I subunit RPA12
MRRSRKFANLTQAPAAQVGVASRAAHPCSNHVPTGKRPFPRPASLRAFHFFHSNLDWTSPDRPSVTHTASMTSINSLLFCTTCGNLLTPTLHNKIVPCEICGQQNQDTSAKTVVTTSKPSAFPSTLRTKLRSDVQEVSTEDMQTDAAVNVTCEKCGCEEVRFYTQQTRGADEGSTVVYTCPKCGFRWNTNN